MSPHAATGPGEVLPHASVNVGCCVPDVCGCLVVLLCCLQTNTHVEAEVEAEVVTAVLAMLMEWRNSQEDWFLFGR